MKQKISVTIDEKTKKKIEKEINEGLFRNFSHAVEFGLNKLMKEKARQNLALEEKNGKSL